MILSFKQRFVPSVTDGTKPHTLRKGHRWRQGQAIQFYENARQPSMRKFRPDAVALVVQAVRVERESMTYRSVQQGLVWPGIFLDERELKPIEAMTLANTDGFDTVDDLMAFLDQAHGLPFIGQLVGWTDLRY